MREIKFRGKRVENGEWVYGNLINWHPKLNPRIVWREYCEIDEYIETNYAIEIDSLGQFTGLKDKNGIEIYEGDKVNYKGEDYEIIYFEDYGCYGMFNEINNKPLGRSGSSTKYEPYFLHNYHLRKIEVL